MSKMHKRALFLIHGFTEDCDQSFGRFLMHTNLDDYQIIKHTVVGHDGVHNFDYDLAIEKLDNEFQIVREVYEEVVVMGFSMGGVLGCYLANKYELEKLVLIAPAFKCIVDSNVFSLLSEASRDLISKRPNLSETKEAFEDYFLQKYSDRDIVFSDLTLDKITDFKHALVNFRKLVNYVSKDFKQINCPTLIIHGEKDELVSVESALYVLNKIYNQSKLLVIAPSCFHRILNEESSTIYYSGIEQFIRSNVFKIDLSMSK